MIESKRSICTILRDPKFLFFSGLFLCYCVMAILSKFDLIAVDYNISDLNKAYQAPNSQHWFGTDFAGRDVLSRTIHGTKIALIVGILSACIATFLGTLLGAIAGFFGGWVDEIIVAFYTMLESIPYVLLISALSFSLGPGIYNLFISLGFTYWVKTCRLIRAECLKQKKMEFIQAAQALGVSPINQLVRHILPNVLHISLVQFSLTLILAIKLEVILSYVGLGVEPGTPSWGIMISDSRLELTRGIWWSMTASTLFMFGLILSINFISDTIKDHLDPRSANI